MGGDAGQGQAGDRDRAAAAGRESSLALLNGYAGEARRGEGRLVLIGGEAGVGKSALVERVRAGTAGCALVVGSMCDGLFTPRPLGPLFDLAEQLGGELLDLCRAGAEREELFRALLAADQRAGARSTWWSSRTSTGPTTPRSTCSDTWDGGCATPRCCSSPPTGTTCWRPDDPLRVALGRSRLAAVHPARRAGAVVTGGGADAGGRSGLAPRRAVPADRREPVLRDRGAARRHPGGAAVRHATRCWRGPRGSATARARCWTWPR